MARRKITDAELATAERVLAGGGSQRQAAKESGLSPDTIKRRFGARDPKPGSNSTPSSPVGPPPHTGGRPRGTDPPPRSTPRDGQRNRRRPAAAPTDEQLENMLRKIAKTPALFMALVVRCDYCATHFRETAPIVARELVAQAAEDPDLHDMLVWSHRNLYRYAWAGQLAFWGGIPLLHHLAPEFVYSRVAPLAGMPPRRPPMHTGHTHAPASGAPPTNGNAPPPTPAPASAFAGGMPDLSQMDPGQLAAMARSLGIDIGEDELAAFLGPEPGIDPEPGSPAPEGAQATFDDFVEPEPSDLDLAVDMLTSEDDAAADDEISAGGDASAESAGGAETSPPPAESVPDSLL